MPSGLADEQKKHYADYHVAALLQLLLTTNVLANFLQFVHKHYTPSGEHNILVSLRYAGWSPSETH